MGVFRNGISISMFIYCIILYHKNTTYIYIFFVLKVKTVNYHDHIM